MNNKEILSKAIDKAIANGWGLEHPIHTNSSIKGFISQLFDALEDYPYMAFESFAGIIFSHSFAKAFFGEDRTQIEKHQILYESDYGVISFTGFAWQYHLQQMVLKENPISYLERFI